MENFVYLVGAEGSDEAAVIDPAWDIEAVAAAASADGRRLTCAIVTHCHHDHINGLPELLARSDLPVFAQRKEIAFSPELRKLAGEALRPVDPGESILVGPLALQLLGT